MSSQALSTFQAHDPTIAGLVRDASAGIGSKDIVCIPAARAAVMATVAQKASRPVLIVTSTQREAEQLTAMMSDLLDADEVVYYPSWETLPHERLSPRSDTVARRLRVLRRVTGRESIPPAVVIAPVRAVLQPQIAGLAELRPVQLAVGEEYDMSQLADDLIAIAYEPADLVERRGQFAMRGGICDVFPPNAEHPVRIDFFGDEIESITSFHVADQRSTDTTIEQVTADPCRELILTDEVKLRARELVDSQPELADMLEKIAQGQTVEGMESLAPALVGSLELLVDVMPADTLVVAVEPEMIRARADELVATSREFLNSSWVAAAAGGEVPIDLTSSAYRTIDEVQDASRAAGQPWWRVSSFSLGSSDDEVILDFQETASYAGDLDGFIAQVTADVKASRVVLLSVDGSGPAKRMSQLLGEHDVPVRIDETLEEIAKPAVVTVFTSTLRHGFTSESLNLTVYTSSDITGVVSSTRPRKMPRKRRNQVAPLELKPGEPIVHEYHGVGRYAEMVTRDVGGTTSEYIVIEYAPSKRGHPRDRLFVPMDQLDQISRYVGGEEPKLDKMGGSDWRARKAKARKAVREIAEELVKLYAARQEAQGFAFSPDTVWQRELEDAFRYEETPDQLAVINDVKADMEKPTPMDRLVCGDVGYGKTEIAVRAAFKATQDNKQVAVLVPTTILVQQHLQTFKDRYAGFPINLGALSRFQSPAETKDTLDGLASGRIDVVIGTHGLFADRVKFKDLGLIIVDEEQRFGVEHKEALKKMRVNVDVLTMSATPIPRTLEMAVTGIREMSTIATPPEERHPVLTFAGPYDEGTVTAAIRRELAREGQVFFIHNRVSDIDKVALRISEAVPEARVMTAHGQMNERTLEQVMLEFADRQADVLVCTTIVESGLDISTANTLIVDQAERMGLSQMHQLRGRVGRSRERGYAYFLYPPDQPLTQTSHDRLAALASNTDLGAGMAIAMKDLEIRGAGNLLGAEQSGHIADVGFDLYIRMVGEAVSAYRGEDIIDEPEQVRIELPVNAHLPTDYVDSERLRLEMYQRLAEVRSDVDIERLASELVDRYGPIPAATSMLLDVARLRLACREVGLTEIVTQGRNIKFAPLNQRVLPDGTVADVPESRMLRLARLHPSHKVNKNMNALLIPRPTSDGFPSAPLDEPALLSWVQDVVQNTFAP